MDWKTMEEGIFSRPAPREAAVKPLVDRHWGPGATIGIIGGRGEMGSLFGKFFRQFGYSVLIADPRGACSNEEVVKNSNVVLFSVPLHLTVPVIRNLIPHVREDQLLMDLSSLKQEPVAEMLRSPASVVGLHPMFGGRIDSFEGHTIIACPVRIDPGAWQGLRTLFESAGMRVKESDPDEHDKMMSIVQVLFHLSTMLMGRVLRQLDIDIEETLEYTSAGYLLEMYLLGRMFAQNSSLYAAITQMNKHSRKVLEGMRQAIEEYQKWYEQSDLQGLISDFEESAAHLGKFCDRAYLESSKILKHVIQNRRLSEVDSLHKKD